MDTVVIKGDVAQASTAEGLSARMSLRTLMKSLTRVPMDTGVATLPDGLKAVRSLGAVTIWVHQTPPATYSFRWIAPDSPVPFGPGARYRVVRIGLPYLVVMAAFVRGPDGRYQLTHNNECFFRNAPLEDLDADPLCFPALLNCSRFPSEEGRPLAWICTQHLDQRALARVEGTNAQMRAGFTALMRCLLDSAFNLSSEAHEGASWFGETVRRRVDARIGSIERWEKETAKNPLFVLEIPWLPTGRTASQVIERSFGLLHASAAPVATAGDIARIIINSNTQGAE